MAKAGMRRPGDNHDPEPYDPQEHVPEIQGSAKRGHEKAGPINAPNWARDNYKSSHHDKD
ncbi:MAG: hypothetical protein Q4G58_05430 [bacterium]|nr:hypothetical protein [bacterium]